MMNAAVVEREAHLKIKRICRFCLTRQPDKLTSIYSHDARIKASTSLPLQIMAIASIEAFEKDDMPSWICTDCRGLFDHCYRFKQMCKQADTLLRQYPLIGKWPEPLERPRPPNTFNQASQRNLITLEDPDNMPRSTTMTTVLPIIKSTDMVVTKTTSKCYSSPRKLLNTAPAAAPEPPAPVRYKQEKKEQNATMIFLNKVENDEELSMDDVHLLIAEANESELNLLTEDDMEDSSQSTYEAPEPIPVKPKLLNKSSMRILNKEANTVKEPRLRKPQLTCDEDGNAVIVTEILDPNDPYDPEPEHDPLKNASPVETNVFPCPHCERTFPLRQLRDIHMVNHNRERSFKCLDCDKSFFSKYDLQKHIVIHTGEKPFKCHVCDKSFTRATLLHRHEKSHTDIPKFICLYCEKPFISRDEMEKHAERHQKHRPFKCKICDKSFAFKQGLERHEVLHSTDLPYPCQYCSESFITPSKLARHLIAHAGRRAFPCKYCPKSYLLSHHLTRHLRSHKQAVTPFVCSVCAQEYKTFSELVQHSNQHAIITLVCPICKMAIDGRDKVGAHIKAHNDGEMFACEFCDLIFLSAHQLQLHIANDHKVDMVPYQQKCSIDLASTSMDSMDTVDIDIKEEDTYWKDDINQEITLPEPSSNKPEVISQIVISGPTVAKVRKYDGPRKPVEATTSSEARNNKATTIAPSSNINISRINMPDSSLSERLANTTMLHALPTCVTLRTLTRSSAEALGREERFGDRSLHEPLSYIKYEK